jgi:hypothetical protein
MSELLLHAHGLQAHTAHTGSVHLQCAGCGEHMHINSMGVQYMSLYMACKVMHALSTDQCGCMWSHIQCPLLVVVVWWHPMPPVGWWLRLKGEGGSPLSTRSRLSSTAGNRTDHTPAAPSGPVAARLCKNCTAAVSRSAAGCDTAKVLACCWSG